MSNGIVYSEAVPKKNSGTKDGITKTIPVKSFQENSRSFVTPDFSDKSTWYFDAQRVTDETATSVLGLTNFKFAVDKTVINLSKVSDRNDWQVHAIVVKKNNNVITSGFTIDYNSQLGYSQVVFSPALQIGDTVKVSYSYARKSTFELTPAPGKKVKFAYVETQFSVGTQLDDILRFELVLNNPNTGNVDTVVGFYEYYNARDYLNKGNHGTVIPAFGELTQDIIVLPWDYQSGYTLKPVGDATTNPLAGEFNKIRIFLKNDNPYTNCEIATGTFYCFIEDL